MGMLSSLVFPHLLPGMNSTWWAVIALNHSWSSGDPGWLDYLWPLAFFCTDSVGRDSQSLLGSMLCQWRLCLCAWLMHLEINAQWYGFETMRLTWVSHGDGESFPLQWTSLMGMCVYPSSLIQQTWCSVSMSFTQRKSPSSQKKDGSNQHDHHHRANAKGKEIAVARWQPLQQPL